MKLFIYSSLIIVALLFGGCAGQESELHTKEKSVPDEAIVSTEVQTKEEIEPVKENYQSIAIDDSKDDGWLKYAEKYNTEHRFADLYMPAKCWLIGNENIVEIISLGGIDDVTVIDHAAIERVEHTNIGEFTTISVFDKTGKSISIMVSLADAEKLLGLIQKN